MTSLNSQNQKRSGTCVVRLSQPDVSSTETVLEDKPDKGPKDVTNWRARKGPSRSFWVSLGSCTEFVKSGFLWMDKIQRQVSVSS